MASPERTAGALITGGGGGIGSAIARELIIVGHEVFLVDSDESSLSTVRDLLTSAFPSGKVSTSAIDVTDSGAVGETVRVAEETLPAIDALVNAAGIEGEVASLSDYSEAIFDRVMAVNVKGTWLVMKDCIPGMVERGRGSIVNVASGAGLRGLPGLSAYVASKHAVVGLTRTAALELATSGIRVNAVCPGPVETPMMQSLENQLGYSEPGEARRFYERHSPERRYAAPAEIAHVVAFLLSDRASFMNGASVAVDAGASA